MTWLEIWFYESVEVKNFSYPYIWVINFWQGHCRIIISIAVWKKFRQVKQSVPFIEKFSNYTPLIEKKNQRLRHNLPLHKNIVDGSQTL